jgi:cytochrome c oxidase subunit IV
MLPMLRHRTTAVWVVLVLATCLSWALGVETRQSVSAFATTILMLIAFIKVRLVGLEFMELRSAPLALRLMFESYVAVVFTVVIGMYLAT